MSTGSDGDLWRRFQHDPRDSAYATMRASDRDRAVVHDVLAEAYAEGRLDRDELDERTTQVDQAKTYGELLPPVRDLIADSGSPGIASVVGPDLRRAAEQYYTEKLRETFFEFLIPNLICWAIWFMTGHDYFVWPIFVTIPTLIHVLQVASSKRRTVEARIEKLERKRAEALAPPKRSKPPDPSQSPTRGEKILSEQEQPEEA